MSIFRKKKIDYIAIFAIHCATKVSEKKEIKRMFFYFRFLRYIPIKNINCIKKYIYTVEPPYNVIKGARKKSRTIEVTHYRGFSTIGP
jgi:beta-xylosidase